MTISWIVRYSHVVCHDRLSIYFIIVRTDLWADMNVCNSRRPFQPQPLDGSDSAQSHITLTIFKGGGYVQQGSSERTLASFVRSPLGATGTGGADLHMKMCTFARTSIRSVWLSCAKVASVQYIEPHLSSNLTNLLHAQIVVDLESDDLTPGTLLCVWSQSKGGFPQAL